MMNDSTPTEVEIDTQAVTSTERLPNKRERHLFEAVEAMNKRLRGTSPIKRDRRALPGAEDRIEAAQQKRVARNQKRADARARQLRTDPVVGRRNGAALARRLSENTLTLLAEGFSTGCTVRQVAPHTPGYVTFEEHSAVGKSERVLSKPRALEAPYGGEQQAHVHDSTA